MKQISMPDPGLVLLIGASGVGKSTFAAKHFAENEILASDTFREMIAGTRDPHKASEATTDAFQILGEVAAARLRRRLLTVIDGTGLTRRAQESAAAIARENHVPVNAIALVRTVKETLQQNAQRGEGRVEERAVSDMCRRVGHAAKMAKRNGIRNVHMLANSEEIESCVIERTTLRCDARANPGPFDIIGDVHGCEAELRELLAKLGYEHQARQWRHPQQRQIVFVGDLVDRGPQSIATVRLVMELAEQGIAQAVEGNHEVKVVKHLRGGKVKLTHGLEATAREIEKLDEEERKRIGDFLATLPSHLVLDGGALVVAHAGLAEEMHLGTGSKVRAFANYGQTSGETDEFGLPVRYQWANDYRGRAIVVYGHTPVPEARWEGERQRVICIDTGCCFGGKLTALRWPERELVEVAAHKEWYTPVRPLVPINQGVGDLDIADIIGEKRIRTEAAGTIRIAEQRIDAASEVAVRFGIDPRWMAYIPPTMAAPPAAPSGLWLEHPHTVFEYYAKQGIEYVVCEEKHMGSRAIAVVAKSPGAAKEAFAIEGPGRIYTRTGRRAIADPRTEKMLLCELCKCIEGAGLWTELDTDWLMLDSELLPWGVLGQGLIENHYRRAGEAGERMFTDLGRWLAKAAENGRRQAGIDERAVTRREQCEAFMAALDAYDEGSEGLVRLAPFHVLAGKGRVYLGEEHAWHMNKAEQLAEHSERVVETRWRTVKLDNEQERSNATEWWKEMTGAGGEGFVVKPVPNTMRRPTDMKWLQPAMKCRGREYLRIIYGPEYTSPEQIERLRDRNTEHKGALAFREYAIGMEGLERLVAGEPLRRIHECALAVLGLESSSVDPRL